MYYDGSCRDPRDSYLARSTYPAVQIDTDRNIVKSIIGNVPRTLRQTSNMAEHCGLVAVPCLFTFCTFAGEGSRQKVRVGACGWGVLRVRATVRATAVR